MKVKKQIELDVAKKIVKEEIASFIALITVFGDVVPMKRVTKEIRSTRDGILEDFMECYKEREIDRK